MTMLPRRVLITAPLYSGRYFPALPSAREVIKRLKPCLEGRGGYEVKALNETISRVRFRDEFDSFCDTDGEILFYFYGHGALSKKGRGFFATSDGEPGDEGIPMGEVIQDAFNSSAREVVLILDCCHAGAFIPSATPGIIKPLAEGAILIKSGRALLAGCASHQQGWVRPTESQKRLGVFSAHILDGLEGARPDPDGRVRASDLGRYVTDVFRSWGQDPISLIHETGNHLCVLTSGYEVVASVPPTSAPAPRKEPLILGVPFKPSQLFVGRTAEIDTLRTTLLEDRKYVAVSAVVEGLGGIGKTELVLQLLNHPDIRAAFDTIIWLDGAGPLPPQWEKIAVTLKVNVPAMDDPAVLVSSVAQALQARGSTLVVLDNASEWNAVSGLIPAGLHLLVTTRTRNFGGNEFRHQELGVLSEEASTSLLIQMVPRLAGDPALGKLVKAIEGHALALELAGGTIESLGLSAAKYLERMQQQQLDPDIVVRVVKYGKTVKGCLDLSWDGLRRDASRVLWRRASLFAPTSAHRDLLRVSFAGDEETRSEMRWIQENQPDYFGQLGTNALLNYDPAEFDQAYAELRAMNVLSRVEGFNGERWAMHRLVRDYGRARVQAGEVMMHAMALSEWLRSPTLDTAPEIPHLVVTILDAARYVGRFRGRRGMRSFTSEVGFRSPVLFDSKYFIEFIRGELRDPRALTIILEGLTDINEDVRAQAIRLLENLGHIPDVLEGLAASLDDPDPSVRAMASQAIVKHGNPKKIGDLLRATMRGGDKPRARLEAVRTLGKLGPPVQSILEEALGSEDPAVRVEAALLLGEQGRDAGRDLIVEALRSPAYPPDRLRAIHALGNIKVAIPADIAVRLLKDSSPQVRQDCIKGLGMAKAAESVPALIDALWDSDCDVRREAASALGLIGDRRARLPLMEVAGKDPHSIVTYAAEKALAQLNDPGVRRAALRALKETKNRTSP